jgi:uncharacterized protein with HEPN domain
MKDERLYLIHISECLQRIDDYLGNGGKDDFMANPMMQDAIIRNLQTMAESTQRISDDLQEKHPEVEWLKIRGLRNVLVHDYLGIDLDKVWNIIANDLPKFKKTIETMLMKKD